MSEGIMINYLKTNEKNSKFIINLCFNEFIV